MAKKIDKNKGLKEKTELALMSSEEVEKLQENYLEELNSNPKYSLMVDPEGIYGMDETQKTFIRHYVEFKNVSTAAELTGIDMDVAKSLFVAYSTQQEIRRINKALVQRQFSTKLATLDDIGGYLTSLLMDENVPIGDRLKTGDKLRVAQMIIDLNIKKQEALIDPTIIMNQNLDIQIKNLSVKTIKQLLENDSQQEIQTIQGSTGLTPEEEAYLSTLPTEDVLKLLEETNSKEGGDNNEQAN